MTRLSRNLIALIISACALVLSLGLGAAPAPALPRPALSWTAQQGISGSGTSAGPALAALNGQLYALWKGTGLDTGLYWASSNGTTWSSQHEIYNVGTSAGPALAAFNGQLYAMWKGTGVDTGL